MNELYDVIIIGGGPAGLTAAIYACRANLKVLIIEAAVNGGKLSKTYEIANYPGFASISGLELADKLTDHAKGLGATIIAGNVEKIEEGEQKQVVLNSGDRYCGKTVIIATGTKEKTLDLPEADRFTGNGISYCAVCDGFFYRKKKVAVIGGGNSALEESLYLSTLADEVTIIIRRDAFRADESVVDKVKANEKIRIIYDSVPQALRIENDRITGLEIRNVKTSETSTVDCSGIFPYIGAFPCTDFADQKILDDKGYIIANDDMSTAIEGIYAAGDCISKDLRQVVTACNDGAIAANTIAKKLKA